MKFSLKKLSIFLFTFFIYTNAFGNEKSYNCENLKTDEKAHIVYHKNYAKEEMHKNIWLFFQTKDIVNDKLNLVSFADGKPIREWKINLSSGEATLTPMFDPISSWICKN
tara:strand:- start:210 stop:539 length:330 start_codon:yes stop_codon:yes gene_type:complete